MSRPGPSTRLALLLAALLSAPPALAQQAACSEAAETAGWTAPTVHTATDRIDFDAFVAALGEQRVVFLGEYHDRFEHHLNQVEIICRLRRAGHRVAIGMEAFQQPFQGVLDAWVAGDIKERVLLQESEYFGRWRFDYRLYAPILRYAREHALPVVALNLAVELTGKVGRTGIASLTPEERKSLPVALDRSSERYRQRVRQAYQMHPPTARDNFENFFDVQLLWDEGMAARGAEYVTEHPDTLLVVIAGEGHVTHGDGIPVRLERRVDTPTATVLQSVARLPEPEAADYRIEVAPLSLPPPGRMGVLVEEAEIGVVIRELTDNSAAGDAGVQPRDRIVSINGAAIEALADVRIALYDRGPGSRVTLEMQRDTEPQTLKFRLR